jgi:HK97 family phage portal protein
MNALARLGRAVKRAMTWDGAAGWSVVRGSTPTEYQRTGREVRLRGWERNPVVGACVRAIVDIYAAVDLEIYRKRADGTAEVIANHEAAQLLNFEPRIGMTGHGLRAQRGVHYLLYGNSLHAIERAGKRGRPMGLRVIHPELLQHVMINTDDVIEEFFWQDSQGRQHRSRTEDILHFKDLTASEDGLFGFPRAAAALQDIAADYEATQYVREVVTNHGVPGLAVKTKGYKKKEDLQAAEEAFNDKMKTRGGRGGAYFINADEVEFEQIGFNLTELEFPDLRAIAREDICASFPVDPRIVGINSATGKEGGMSGVQFREARFKLIQQAVIPMMKAHESELNRWFMPEYGDVYCRFSPDILSEMTEDEGATSTRVINEVKARIRTVEEGRETIGLSAEIDPTHHLGGMSMTLVSVALAQAEKDPATQAKELAAAAGGPSPAPGKGATPPQRALPAPPITRVVALTSEQRAALWGEFDTRASREESAIVRAVLRLFGLERSRVDALMAEARAEIIEAVLQELGEIYRVDGEIHTAWVDQTTPVIGDVFRTGFGDLAATMGIDLTIENPRAKAAIRRRANKLAGHATDTTYEQIRSLLLVGREQGLAIQAMADLINATVFEDQAPERARTIARTETIGALNEGAYVAALDGGVMRSKSWLSQRDDKVRETHTHAEGQGWIPLGRAFDNGLQYPGDQGGGPEEVCNCRCTLLYSDEEK